MERISFEDLLYPKQNQDHRDPFSGAGAHAGQAGSASFAIRENNIQELDTAHYTKNNLIIDIVNKQVPNEYNGRKNSLKEIMFYDAQKSSELMKRRNFNCNKSNEAHMGLTHQSRDK